MNRHSDLIRRRGLLVFSCFLMVYFGAITSSFAQPIQRIEIPSSFNPVGSGARALGMGGAFIAIADDATAASWNPGGLIQLETPEISVVGAYFHRTEDNTFGTNPEASGSHSVSKGSLNYLSAAYPFTLWDHNMIVSLNYQNLYDLTREWRFPLRLASDDFSLNQNVDYNQEGTLSATGLAYCIQVCSNFSLGFTLNFWEDGIYENEWEQETIQTGSGTYAGYDFTFQSRSVDKYTFSGINANLGFLWNLNSKLTLGAVLKTPFTADIEHKSMFDSAVRFPEVPEADTTSSDSSVEDIELDMPMSYGFGLAYRFSDAFSASIDFYRTKWDDFVLIDANGNLTSPISGRPFGQSDVDATHQVRLGAEYLFIGSKYVIPLRAGGFYDPAPAEGRTDDFYGFAVGSGIAWRWLVFDIAYQYRFGTDVGTSILQNLDFSQDVDEHTVYSSIIVHF